jgi:hypothetical protein
MQLPEEGSGARDEPIKFMYSGVLGVRPRVLKNYASVSGAVLVQSSSSAIEAVSEVYSSSSSSQLYSSVHSSSELYSSVSSDDDEDSGRTKPMTGTPVIFRVPRDRCDEILKILSESQGAFEGDRVGMVMSAWGDFVLAVSSGFAGIIAYALFKPSVADEIIDSIGVILQLNVAPRAPLFIPNWSYECPLCRYQVYRSNLYCKHCKCLLDWPLEVLKLSEVHSIEVAYGKGGVVVERVSQTVWTETLQSHLQPTLEVCELFELEVKFDPPGVEEDGFPTWAVFTPQGEFVRECTSRTLRPHVYPWRWDVIPGPEASPDGYLRGLNDFKEIDGARPHSDVQTCEELCS